MDITLSQAYDSALAMIGRLTVEQSFLQQALADARADADRLQAQVDEAVNLEPGHEKDTTEQGA